MIYRVLPESPRWLLAVGRKDEVLAILQEAARINKRTLAPSLDKVLRQVSVKALVSDASCLHAESEQLHTNSVRQNVH
jgi:hypothetical protein